MPWEHLAPLGKTGCCPSATSWGGVREKAAPSLRGCRLQAEMCWAAAEGSKEMSKGWAEELLQVQGLIWRASLSLGFGLKSSSRFRVWSEELLQSMVVWEKRASG